MDPSSEKRLINACLEGEPEAQKKLYLNFKGRLFPIALRYSDSYEEAQDILQDGFIKIYRDLKDYRPIAPLYAWMKTVIIRTALECIRRKKSRIGRGYPIDAVYDLGTNEKVSAELGAQDLLALISKLSEDYRTVFNLYAIDGFSHKEIGQMLSISEGSSKMRLSRARTILKKEVEILFELK